MFLIKYAVWFPLFQILIIGHPGIGPQLTFFLKVYGNWTTKNLIL